MPKTFKTIPELTKTQHQEFEAKIDKATHPVGCWIWRGFQQRNGYGYFWVNSGTYLAHRISWEIASGEKIPEGMLVLHSCDNPICVNPHHLRLGTYTDNYKDAVTRRRRPKQRRAQRQWAERNTRFHRVSRADWRYLRELATLDSIKR